MTKKTILNELFFSMSCEHITGFLLRQGIFSEFECVTEYSPSALGEIINHLHEEEYDVQMLFSRGISDNYIYCKKAGFRVYHIDFLSDDNDQFTETFDFEEKILPILLSNKMELDWVAKHSERKLTKTEKRMIGLGVPVKFTIEVTYPCCVDKLAEVEAIKEIMGFDELGKQGIISCYSILTQQL